MSVITFLPKYSDSKKSRVHIADDPVSDLAAVQSDAGADSEDEWEGALHVFFNSSIVDKLSIRSGRTTIGRGPNNDIRLDSSYVSFSHSVITTESGQVEILDLHSRNRTLVNGVAVQRSVLNGGDVIGIGDFVLRYLGASAGLPQRYPPPKNVAGAEISNDADSSSLEHGSTVVIDDISTLEPGDLEAAVAEAVRQDRNPLEILVETTGWDEPKLVRELGKVFSYQTIDTRQLMKLRLDFSHFSTADARQRGCLITQVDGKLVACIWDPFDSEVRSWVEARVAEELEWSLVTRGDLNACLSRHEQSLRAIDSALESAGDAQHLEVSLEDLSMASIGRDSSPVVKLVRSTLFDALRANASDIHMESGSGKLEIRYRIDGVLVHVASVSGVEIAEQVVSRIKVMSELDISERRIPQDGRFRCAYDGRPIDFRVSIMPSTFGEDAVLRVLDKQAITDQMSELRIDGLGFDEDIVASLSDLARLPHGMLLVTGPTGSGKTTTLYAAISETNTGMGKIVTIEDPVEYQLPGVLQIPVNEKKGLTFARGLRSILRHDPDKIMVGEIRDPETAQIAVQSALTGHLVFTTVHANNVFDVLSRFEHMGVDVYSFVAALNGILAQRLVRVICLNCADTFEPAEEQLEATGLPRAELRSFDWRVGRGCSDCRGTGFRGRKAIGELLVLNDELREAIISRAPVRQLKDLAHKNNLRFIRSAALDLVRHGMTTIEEVNRVIAVS